MDDYTGGDLPDSGTYYPCTPGVTTDCDNNPANGCETNTLVDPARCGTCQNVCSGSTPTCRDGQCRSSCPTGREDCDHDPSNGCETDVTTIDNCDSCGKRCLNTANATAVCKDGKQCDVVCSSGYGNCDGDIATGCEVLLDTDPKNCGTCRDACSTVHGTPSCAGRACSIQCDSGYGDCDGDVKTGCENDLNTDPSHCGTCIVACPAAPAQATATCDTGHCGWACFAGWGDCNKQAADGCEIDLTSTTANCGQCGHDCAGASCSRGMCEPVILASGLNQPAGIAVDSSNVYWTDTWDNQVLKVAKSGPPKTVLANYDTTDVIGTDGTNVYWHTGIQIARCSVTPGPTTVWVPNQNDAVPSLIVDTTFVYWVNQGVGVPGDGGITYNGSVVGAAKATGTVSPNAIQQNLPVALTVDNNFLYWTNQGMGSDGAVRKILKSGGSVLDVSPMIPSKPCGIAVNTASIFWVENCAGGANAQKLMKAAKTGGSPSAIAQNQTISGYIAADDQYVYWSLPGSAPGVSDGVIMEVTADGTKAPMTIAAGQNHPGRIALDTTRVYWVNAGTLNASPPLGDGAVASVVK